MKIATWNVNSVRARVDNIESFIREESPDVILMQEIKCREEFFPYDFFSDLGYTSKIQGQKSYNGVAILSKYSIEDVQIGLPNFQDDETARYIQAVIDGNICLASVYVPNGGLIVGAEPYVYKLNFLNKLKEHLIALQQDYELVLIGGDYNIAPDNLDVYDENVWRDKVCCTTKERKLFEDLKSTGLTDIVQDFFDDATATKKRFFTWWGYTNRSSFERNMGLRLDHFLVNEDVKKLISNVNVVSKFRAMAKPSDHAPVVIELTK